MAQTASERAQARLAYGLVAPATLLLLLIYVIPIAVVIAMSLTDYTLVSDYYEFVGFENYAKMLSEEPFRNALWNTFVYAAFLMPLSFGLGLVIAIAIQERQQFRSILEVLFFLPVTATLTAMALVFAALMDSRQGVFNNTLETFGLSGLNWLGSETLVLFSLAIISLWALIGFNMVLFLAGLTAIPKSLYDAAAIDGADGAIDKFFRVTWPMLGPTAMFVAVTNSITAFKIFDTVAVLTQGGPNRASEVYLYLAYLEGFEYFNMGYSAALSLVFLAIIFAFALIQALVIDRKVHY
ncbi:MAG: sugar ABC transporter permease [Pseudomonadota bacterium]